MSDNTQQATDQRIDNRTTEQKTASARKTMRFYKSYQTVGREHGRNDGWYYTEPKTPCGVFDFTGIEGLENLVTMFGNEKEWVQGCTA